MEKEYELRGGTIKISFSLESERNIETKPNATFLLPKESEH